jgi:hypothetical protein
MTYALSWPLQKAIYETLTASQSITDILVGKGKIFDEPPHANSMGTAILPYIVLGDEKTTNWSDKDTYGAIHNFEIIIYSSNKGFKQAKLIAGIVCDALLKSSPPILIRGTIVDLHFVSGEAVREKNGDYRKITLKFQGIIEDS